MQCLQQRPADQVAGLVDLALDLVGRGAALHGAHVQQLRGMVPLVQRFALFQSVVALQADQRPPEHGGKGFGEFGLAHTRLAFEQ